MGKLGPYRVKVKSGRNYIEIQGDKKFTEDVFKQITVIFPKQGKKPEPKKRGRKPILKQKIDLKSISFDELISKLKEQKTHSQVHISGYILNKNLKKREFRAKDMESFMMENNIEVPKNITYHFRNLKDSGHFTQGRKQGRFKITEMGIKEIEKLF